MTAPAVDDGDTLSAPPEPLGPLPAQAALSALRQRLSRIYLVAVGTMALALPLLYLVLQPRDSGRPLGAMGLLYGAIVLAALGAAWRRPGPRAMESAVTAVALLAVAAVVLSAARLGWGLAAPGLGYIALHAAFTTTLVGSRQGLLVGATGIGAIAVLGWAQATGRVAGVAGPMPVALHALVQALLVVIGCGGGWVVSRLLRRFILAADDRERRFAGLLKIAADSYWELDPHNRLLAMTRERGDRQVPEGARASLGRVPWELPQFGCDPEVLDRLQADIEARLPFRDVPVGWRLESGERSFLVSGEPRFDDAGVFTGYWGVARDITDDLVARRRLLRTESRYHDLFAAIPNALVLHRDGRVIDANPAAVALLGYDDLATMIGTDVLESFQEGESRERARERAQHIQQQPAGESLPVAEFRLRTRTGRSAVVRATGVAVETERGGAVLTIFVDDTERHLAEDALRRSEALLSHLVASSPDVITLTELATGRYAMVNRSFERITGWKSEEVIGREAGSIGVWADPTDRERLVRQVQALGRVQDLPLQFRCRDGSLVPMLVSGARFAMDRRDYLVVNARDMTEVERSRLEREAILENASLGIALTRDQRFQLVNPAFEQMLGWGPGEIIGQPGAVVWPSAEAYAEIGRRIGPPLARGEQVEVECEVRRQDGSTFLCRMLARAVDPSHPIRGGTIWVVEDITERRRLDEALARARDAAEAASRAKSAFLANTSHELRTPLNGLLNLAQLARTPGLDEARRTQYLDHIVDSAQSLAMIVSDILDLSKIEAGRLAIESAVFDLGAMLQSLARSYATLAASRGLALTLEADPALGTVSGDALRVRQILTNYLGNAIKFTAAGGVRLVARREAGDTVRVEVHDTGPGIGPATQERLFRPFTQADESTTRRYGGTGLGLSICRELATLMGGAVGVQSQPGHGSCFWVTLPLPPAAPPPGEGAVAVDAAATHGAHVLMVDDNAVNMMVAAAQLEQFGVRVGQAVDGRQALDAVAAAEAAGDPYDLVFMDLQMPDLSGFEVTRQLRRTRPADRLPIVAHTAAALVTERDAALAAGMNDFLPKPSDSEALRAMVARWASARGDRAPR